MTTFQITHNGFDILRVPVASRERAEEMAASWNQFQSWHDLPVKEYDIRETEFSFSPIADIPF